MAIEVVTVLTIVQQFNFAFIFFYNFVNFSAIIVASLLEARFRLIKQSFIFPREHGFKKTFTGCDITQSNVAINARNIID